MNRRGVTLAECAVALAAGGLVLAALHALLLAAARVRERETARREVRTALRAAATILRGELQAVSAPAGDIVALGDSAITVRAFRGQGATCAAGTNGEVILARASWTGLRAADPARDAVRIFLDPDPLDATDDAWHVAALTAVRASACDDGGGAVALAFAPALAAAAEPGTPVRVMETVEYRVYADAAGQRWLGTRTRLASGWTVTSPLAGPLRPGGGLHITAEPLGSAAAPGTAALLTLALRARSSAPVRGSGGARAPLVDSLVLSVAVGR